MRPQQHGLDRPSPLFEEHLSELDRHGQPAACFASAHPTMPPARGDDTVDLQRVTGAISGREVKRREHRGSHCRGKEADRLALNGLAMRQAEKLPDSLQAIWYVALRLGVGAELRDLTFTNPVRLFAGMNRIPRGHGAGKTDRGAHRGQAGWD